MLKAKYNNENTPTWIWVSTKRSCVLCEHVTNRLLSIHHGKQISVLKPPAITAHVSG